MKIRGLLLHCFVWVALEWCGRGATGDRSLRSLKFQSLDLFPESFDWDPGHGRFLLGSAAAGTISELAKDGAIKEFVRDDEYAGKVGVAGVKVDRRRNRVIAAVTDFVDGNYCGVAAYDLDTREKLYFARLDNVGVAEGEKSCSNDVAVDSRSGTVYVTNCIGNFLWKVTLEGTPSVFVKHDSFTSQSKNGSPTNFAKNVAFPGSIGAWCGLNGIIYEPGKHLLVAHTNSGALFRVKVDDRSVHIVTMKNTMPGADGMALREDGALVVVSTETLWLVGSTTRWTAAKVLDSIPLNASDFATATTTRKGSTFVVHSHLADMFAQQPREHFEVLEMAFPVEAGDNDPVWLVVLVVLIVVVVSLWRFQMGHLYKQYRRKRV